MFIVFQNLTSDLILDHNFDMFEEMKFLALVEKAFTGDPTAASAEDVFACATSECAKIFNLNFKLRSC